MFNKQNYKTLSLSMIDIQEKATKDYVAALDKFVGPDFATYMWGLNYMNGLYFNNARKVVQELENITFASSKE
jgi:hypothetical protein